VHAVPRENAVHRELEIFLAAPNIPIYQSLDDDASTSHHDDAEPILTPLQWCASHNINYPNLSKVVRLLLAVPATSVSSETFLQSWTYYI